MRRAVILVVLGACGGAPELVAPDAGRAAPDAEVVEPCAAPAPMGDLPALTDGEAVIDLRADDTHYRIDYNGRIADTTLLRFVFREGGGAFPDQLAPGAYPVDSDLDACGACALLVTRYFEPAHSQYLVAQAGTLTLTRVDRTADGRLVGSADGLTLQRVVYDGAAWVPEDGCTTTLEHVDFDVPLTPGPFFPQR